MRPADSLESPPKLRVLHGFDPQVFELGEGLTIVGNSMEAGLPLYCTALSPEHFLLERQGAKCWISLLETHPVNLNGRPLRKRTELQDGDLIHVATVALCYTVHQNESCDVRMFTDGTRVQSVALDQTKILIGSGRNCDVLISGQDIEPEHALIENFGGTRTLRLMSTTAGGMLNRLPFEMQVLTAGDLVQLGTVLFRFDGQRLTLMPSLAGLAVGIQNLTYRKREVTALHPMSLQVPPSSFTSVIGPSGAGKSTLLKLIGGCLRPSAGRAILDGLDAWGQMAAGRGDLGWVPQDDIVHKELSVRQALRYAARLRMSSDIPMAEIDRKISQVLGRLDLEAHLHTRVGRLSGGERKRVSVAAEMLGEPGILILDEPSSGLDPLAERELMSLLRDLSNRGCTILCSTHNAESLYLCDQLIVLNGGHLVFSGTPSESQHFFGVDNFAAIFERLAETGAEEIGEANTVPTAVSRPRESVAKAKHRGPGQLSWLFAREFALFFADRRNPVIAVLQPLLIGLLFAWAVRSTVDDSTLKLFLAGLATLWLGCANGAGAIVGERAIYDRERMAGLSRHAYVLTKWSFVCLISLLQGLLLFGVSRDLGSEIGGDALWQVGGLVMIGLVGASMGLALSSVAGTAAQAMFLVPFCIIPQIVLSGFTVQASMMRGSVLSVAPAVPVFQLQRLFDGSLFWGREVGGELLQTHFQAWQNLQMVVSLKTGERFEEANFALQACLVLLAWTLLSILLVEAALWMRERNPG